MLMNDLGQFDLLKVVEEEWNILIMRRCIHSLYYYEAVMSTIVSHQLQWEELHHLNPWVENIKGSTINRTNSRFLWPLQVDHSAMMIDYLM